MDCTSVVACRALITNLKLTDLPSFLSFQVSSKYCKLSLLSCCLFTNFLFIYKFSAIVFSWSFKGKSLQSFPANANSKPIILFVKLQTFSSNNFWIFNWVFFISGPRNLASPKFFTLFIVTKSIFCIFRRQTQIGVKLYKTTRLVFRTLTFIFKVLFSKILWRKKVWGQANPRHQKRYLPLSWKN